MQSVLSMEVPGICILKVTLVLKPKYTDFVYVGAFLSGLQVR